MTSTENIFQSLSALLLGDPFVLSGVMSNTWKKGEKEVGSKTQNGVNKICRVPIGNTETSEIR